MPRVIQVIESDEVRGKGTESDPFRSVTMYHTLRGKFLAENDPQHPEIMKLLAERRDPACEGKERT